MRALLLRREDPLSWSLVPEVCERIRRFCELVGSDTPAEMLVQAYWQSFVQPKPLMIAGVALDDTGIVAHVLLVIEEWAGTRTATVFQHQHDRPIPREELRRGFEAVLTWARSCGAMQFQGLALDRRVARIARQRYGFKEHRILMRRPIEPEVPSP